MGELDFAPIFNLSVDLIDAGSSQHMPSGHKVKVWIFVMDVVDTNCLDG
jgi:hypothetical protein